MKTVYLAGPISGLSYTGCTDWRETAARQLEHHTWPDGTLKLGLSGDPLKSDIKALSPMRCKEYLSHLEVIDANGAGYDHLGALSTARGVMTRDHFDATRCDVMLVNLLGAERVSIGTVMEMAWAFQKRTPVVCVIEPDGVNPHEHIMLTQAIDFRVASLMEAVDIVKAILL